MKCKLYVSLGAPLLAVIMPLGNLLEMQILRPYPKCAKSGTLEMELSNLCFRKF